MWFLRELFRLVMRIAVATVIACAIAGVLAAVSAHSFESAARVLFIAIGGILLAMAGVGSGSNLERYMDQSLVERGLGTIPFFDANKRHPEDPTLTPGAVFASSGLVLIAIGILVF